MYVFAEYLVEQIFHSLHVSERSFGGVVSMFVYKYWPKTRTNTRLLFPESTDTIESLFLKCSKVFEGPFRYALTLL